MQTESDKAEGVLESVGLPREDSLAQRIGEFTLPIFPGAKIPQVLSGLAAGAANYLGEKQFPDNPLAQFGLTAAGAFSPAGLELGLKNVFRAISPKAGGTALAKKIAGQIREVTPDALTEAITPGERATTAATAMEAQGRAARKEAGALFGGLSDDSVTLDNAIENITNFANEVSGPIAPGSKSEQIINFLGRLKPKEQIIDLPASTILDEFGKPIIEAQKRVIPAGPATLPLNKVQDVLRDIGSRLQGAEGVDRAVLARAREEILGAAESTVKDKAALDSFKESRAAWRQMSQTYEEGAVGAVRKSLQNPEGRLNTFKNKLLNDPKSAEQLTKIMNPEELANTQNLVLSELFKKQPVSWERSISNSYDSYRAIFGDAGAEKLLGMVSRDGTIGKKLLQDNNGLKTLFAKLGLRTAIGATIGYEGGGVEGAVIGGLAGLALNKGEGASVARAKSLLMRAAAGSDEAIKILNTPTGGLGYESAINALAKEIKKTFSGPEATTNKTGKFFFNITPAENLSEEGARIQAESINRLNQGGEKLVDKYLNKITNENNVITFDVDSARPLVSESSYAPGTHEAASALDKKAFEIFKQKENIPSNFSLLIGAPGSGKSSINLGPLKNGVVMQKTPLSVDRIEEIIQGLPKAIKNIEISFIEIDPIKSLERAWTRSSKQGRGVPLGNFAKAAISMPETAVESIKRLRKYKNIHFSAFDNSGTKAEPLPLDKLGQILYNRTEEGIDSIYNRLNTRLNQLYEQELKTAKTEDNRRSISERFSQFREGNESGQKPGTTGIRSGNEESPGARYKGSSSPASKGISASLQKINGPKTGLGVSGLLLNQDSGDTSMPSGETIALVKTLEGKRLKVYKDTGGVKTIGYGHTGDGVDKGIITEKEAEELLQKDLTKAESAVLNAVQVDLTPSQLSALTSLVYNVGEGAFKNSTLLKKLNAGDIAGAAAEFDRWVYDNGKRVMGLVNRRGIEKRLFLRA